MTGSTADRRIRAIASLPLQPVGQRRGFFSGTFESIREIWQHRELTGLLIRREVKARYKDSSLGLIWSLARPLSQLLVYYFVIGKVLGAERNIPSFAVFVFIGLTMWSLYSEIVGNGTKSILDNAGLVKKIYLPREIFPLASVGGALFNFGVQFVVLLAAVIVMGQFPVSTDLLYLPLAFIVAVLFATGFAFLLSAINVYLRDIQHLVDVVMVVLFWASPIVYSYKYVHDLLLGNWLEQIYLSNPVTLAILGAQKALWAAGSSNAAAGSFPPDLAARLFIAAGVGVIFVWLSQRFFERLQGNFAQEL